MVLIYDKNTKSTESQASGTWTNQETHKFGGYFRQSSRFRQDSGKFWSESFASSGTDWEGTSVPDKRDNSITGKIVQQLILDVQGELDETENKANKLRERLNVLQSLLTQLPNKDQ